MGKSADLLTAAFERGQQKGVRRVHRGAQTDGALISELFESDFGTELHYIK